MLENTAEEDTKDTAEKTAFSRTNGNGDGTVIDQRPPVNGNGNDVKRGIKTDNGISEFVRNI